MGEFQKFVENDTLLSGESTLYLSVDAAGNWTDQFGRSVGTTPTSGIYKMKGPGCIFAVSALADTGAIIYLPPAISCPGKVCIIHAPTGAAGGDISVYDEETGAEITTYGDMDADADHAIWMSTGLVWTLILDGVA